MGSARFDQLTRVGTETLLEIHGVGPKAVAILREELATRDLSFAGTRLPLTWPLSGAVVSHHP